MKKQFLTIVLIFSALIQGNSQNDANTKKSVGGLKAGYNLAAVSFDGDSETGQRHGFHIGFYGESFINESLAVQVELLYSQQGYELKDNGGTFTQKLNYINLPLMFKAYPSENLFLELGPQIGLAISHKESYDAGFNVFDTSQEFDPNSFDYGVNFGGGFKIDPNISLGVRYHLGLGDVYDEGKPQNRVWQFSIGFDF